MAIQDWSDNIIVVDLTDDPQFSDEITALMDRLEDEAKDVVLNFGAVGFVNSSNIAKLLRLRKIMIAADRKLVLCDVNTQVWGVLLVTGLDKIFTYTNDVATALATLQLGV
jgi:anti-anti-sigma factor